MAYRSTTHLGQNAEYIPSNVFVRRYSANMSSMGTSGVGWFCELSQSRFRELSRSVRNKGIWLPTTADTRSNCLHFVY